MNPAFGAMIRSRRRSLHLTQTQLAQRMASQGTLVNVGPLEDGTSGDLPRDTLTALANALEWPVHTLELVNAIPTKQTATSDRESPSDNADVIDHQAQLVAIQAELMALRGLHSALLHWTDDLEARVTAVFFGLDRWKRPIRFDD